MIRFFFLYWLPFRFWALLSPVREHRYLFLSDSHDGFIGNMAFLRDALHTSDPDAEFVGIFKQRLAAHRPLRDVLRLPYLLATSRVVILDDYYPLIYSFRMREGVRLVQIWHAAGAFKKVGHSRVGMPGGPHPGSPVHRNYSDVAVSSEGIIGHYAEAFGIPAERVHAWGMPRSDRFFDSNHVSDVRGRVRDELGIGSEERFAVYAPTFRGNGQRSAKAPPDADWSAIAVQLGPGWRIGVRHHPFVRTAGAPDTTVDTSSIVDLNDLLLAADVLITDYSSTIFEYALLRRPIVFFVPDLDEYQGSRSFYRPFDEYAIGPIVKSADDLTEAIRTATVDRVAFDEFLQEFCSALDGRSSERIARSLLPHSSPSVSGGDRSETSETT